jgi:hypothetical protein
VVVVGRVGHGRSQYLADQLGRLALGPRQYLGRPIDILAADQVEDLPGLGG